MTEENKPDDVLNAGKAQFIASVGQGMGCFMVLSGLAVLFVAFVWAISGFPKLF